MEEIDLIDENGQLTGKTELRNIVHKFGLRHHASGLIIISKFNGGGWKLLSQQRSYKKDKNAGLWDLSASGHVPSGETPLNSLIREVKEELGLNINANDLKFLGKFWRNEIYRNDFIENELDFIYVLNKEVNKNEIIIQQEEVENVDWIEIEEFKRLLKNKQAVNREGVWEKLFDFIKNNKV